jgi:hypothetical protein
MLKLHIVVNYNYNTLKNIYKATILNPKVAKDKKNRNNLKINKYIFRNNFITLLQLL